MKRSIVIFVLIGFLFALPVYPVKKDTKLILDEIQKLTALVQNLGEKVASVSAELAGLQKKVGIIENKVSAVAESQADFNQSRENVSLSLQFIKEEINELKNKISALNDRLLTLSTAAVTETVPAEGEDNQNTMTQSPESIYFTAYSDYLKKNYELAIKGFRQFIDLYPQNGLADNSLYWIGECYYAQRMYQEAVNTFAELIEKYGEGDKVPAATLKQGFALIEMGKQSEGVTVLKALISRFPLSEEASLAQQKIKEVSD
jgi:tol-pal system protein YbgF